MKNFAFIGALFALYAVASPSISFRSGRFQFPPPPPRLDPAYVLRRKLSIIYFKDSPLRAVREGKHFALNGSTKTSCGLVALMRACFGFPSLPLFSQIFADKFGRTETQNNLRSSILIQKVQGNDD